MPPPGAAVGARAIATEEANKKATRAMIWSILGICCFICSIVGIVMGVQANKDGADNGHGTAAIIIGAILLGLNVIGGIVQLAVGLGGGGLPVGQ